jgi:hypothetical protein
MLWQGVPSDEFSSIFKQLYPPSLFPKLNEVPASIAQLLKKRVHYRLVDQLKLVASRRRRTNYLKATLAIRATIGPTREPP